MKCECKGCTVRKMNCHSTCKSYKEFVEENEKVKKAMKREDADFHIIENNLNIGKYLANKKKRSKRVGMW